jgi:hypothetical protein
VDWVGILLLTVPIFLPIMKGLEWSGLLGFAGVKAEERHRSSAGSFH